MRKALAVGLSLSLIACANGDAPLKSGSRVIIKHLRSDEGKKVPIGIFDTKLDAACSPAKAPDGNTYCMPSQGMVFYSDNKCTTRVALMFGASCAGAETAKYATERTTTGEQQQCGETQTDTFETFALGAEIVGATTVYYKSSDGSNACNEGTNFVTPGVDKVFAVGNKVPTTELASLTAADVKYGSRLTLPGFESADGALIPAVSSLMRDGTNKVYAISLETNGSDMEKVVWGTANTAMNNIYSDASCSKNVVGLSSCDKAETTLARVESEGPNCTRISKLYSVDGATALSQTNFFSKTQADGSCGATSLGSSAKIYGLGSEVTPKGNVTGSLVKDKGKRLSKLYYQNDDGSQIMRGWYDEQLRVSCYLSGEQGKAVSCMPQGDGQIAYSDSACTAKVIAVRTDNLQGSDCYAGGIVANEYPQTSGPATCEGSKPSIHVAGARIGKQKAYVKSGTDCIQDSTDYMTFKIDRTLSSADMPKFEMD